MKPPLLRWLPIFGPLVGVAPHYVSGCIWPSSMHQSTARLSCQFSYAHHKPLCSWETTFFERWEKFRCPASWLTMNPNLGSTAWPRCHVSSANSAKSSVTVVVAKMEPDKQLATGKRRSKVKAWSGKKVGSESGSVWKRNVPLARIQELACKETKLWKRLKTSNWLTVTSKITNIPPRLRCDSVTSLEFEELHSSPRRCRSKNAKKHVVCSSYLTRQDGHFSGDTKAVVPFGRHP